MGWLKPATKIPPQWDAMFMRKLIERIRTALNFLDASNFPNGLSGAVLNQNTVDPKRLGNMYMVIPIVALGAGWVTTQTDPTSVGGSIPWLGSVWAGTVDIRLFITGGSSNESATATYELHGVDGVIASVTISSATYIPTISDAVSPPEDDQNLVLKVKTSNGSYAAGLLNAMIVITPKTS